jgi:hypothetical protein
MCASAKDGALSIECEGAVKWGCRCECGVAQGSVLSLLVYGEYSIEQVALVRCKKNRVRIEKNKPDN